MKDGRGLMMELLTLPVRLIPDILRRTQTRLSPTGLTTGEGWHVNQQFAAQHLNPLVVQSC